jgi:hypothetical protein
LFPWQLLAGYDAMGRYTLTLKFRGEIYVQRLEDGGRDCCRVIQGTDFEAQYFLCGRFGLTKISTYSGYCDYCLHTGFYVTQNTYFHILYKINILGFINKMWESPKEKDHLKDQGVDGRMG